MAYLPLWVACKLQKLGDRWFFNDSKLPTPLILHSRNLTIIGTQGLSGVSTLAVCPITVIPSCCGQPFGWCSPTMVKDSPKKISGNGNICGSSMNKLSGEWRIAIFFLEGHHWSDHDGSGHWVRFQWSRVAQAANAFLLWKSWTYYCWSSVIRPYCFREVTPWSHQHLSIWVCPKMAYAQNWRFPCQQWLSLDA